MSRASVSLTWKASLLQNKNYQSVMHCDKRNLGPSTIVGLGDYTDGKLWGAPPPHALLPCPVPAGLSPRSRGLRTLCLVMVAQGKRSARST